MNNLKLVLPTIFLALSTNVNATTYTYGNLTSDDTTDFITNTVTSREYLRFDTFNLSYADTLAAVGTGGLYDGWSVATSDVADDFYSAILGVGSTSCSGPNLSGTLQPCGFVSGWVEGAFGDSFNSVEDYFWYLSTNDTPNRNEYEVGFGYIDDFGLVGDYDDWTSGIDTDIFNGHDIYRMNAMVYRDVPSPVPAPAAAWLFGSALFGFFGFSRRKANA